MLLIKTPVSEESIVFPETMLFVDPAIQNITDALRNMTPQQRELIMKLLNDRNVGK